MGRNNPAKSLIFLVASLALQQALAKPSNPSASATSQESLLNSMESMADAAFHLAAAPNPQHRPTPANSFHIVSDCVTISMDEGVFHYKSKGTLDTCGLYFLAEPDKMIIVTIDYLNAECEQHGLISVVDGWEFNGELFPSVEDHEKGLESRFHEFCGRRRIREQFQSSQNAALIQYRIPRAGQGFSVRVRHVPNPRPCNILVQDTEAIFTLQNFGRDVNCSLTTLFDAKIRLLYLNTGLGNSQVALSSGFPIGTLHKCEKLGLTDYVQLGGSTGINTSKMQVIDEFCGHDPSPASAYTMVFCGMSTIRLVSSGKFHNRVVVEVRRAELEELDNANYICDL